MRSTRRCESWLSDTWHRLDIQFKWITLTIAMRSPIKLAAGRSLVGSIDASRPCETSLFFFFSAIPFEGLSIGSDVALRRIHSLPVPFGRTQSLGRCSTSDSNTNGEVRITMAHSSRALLSLSSSTICHSLDTGVHTCRAALDFTPRLPRSLLISSTACFSSGCQE
jgi:hypothetical protein